MYTNLLNNFFFQSIVIYSYFCAYMTMCTAIINMITNICRIYHFKCYLNKDANQGREEGGDPQLEEVERIDLPRHGRRLIGE